MPAATFLLVAAHHAGARGLQALTTVVADCGSVPGDNRTLVAYLLLNLVERAEGLEGAAVQRLLLGDACALPSC
jgi:hypothetical protein